MLTARTVVDDVWQLAGGAPGLLDRLELIGPEHALPSVFAVTPAATGVVASAITAIAEFDAARSSSEVAPVVVDSRHATWSFRDEKHALIDGVAPQVWADLSGYYETSDGFVQVHANFPHHGARALEALGLPSDAPRDLVEREIRGRARVDIEDVIVANGGICSAFRSLDEWREHPHAQAIGEVPPLLRTERPVTGPVRDVQPASKPLTGVRVLDLTRILAGPVAARTMAAFGAEVLRVGAPGLPSHEMSVALTAVGKRFTHIDLASPEGRDVLFALAEEADVVLTGFRPGALATLGVDNAALRNAQPNLIIGELSAFGSSGAWGGRRGYDSITQTATGIAHEGMVASGTSTPTPLPCQLLDYATGYLLAAGVVRSLTDRLTSGSGYDVEVVLARTGRWLESMGRVDDGFAIPMPTASDVAPMQEKRASPFGVLDHFGQPGSIGSMHGAWSVGPERPGQSAPVWQGSQP